MEAASFGSNWLELNTETRKFLSKFPRELGAKGLGQVIEITLIAEERIALQKTGAGVQELVNILGIWPAELELRFPYQSLDSSQ